MRNVAARRNTTPTINNNHSSPIENTINTTNNNNNSSTNHNKRPSPINESNDSRKKPATSKVVDDFSSMSFSMSAFLERFKFDKDDLTLNEIKMVENFIKTHGKLDDEYVDTYYGMYACLAVFLKRGQSLLFANEEKMKEFRSKMEHFVTVIRNGSNLNLQLLVKHYIEKI